MLLDLLPRLSGSPVDALWEGAAGIVGCMIAAPIGDKTHKINGSKLLAETLNMYDSMI